MKKFLVFAAVALAFGIASCGHKPATEIVEENDTIVQTEEVVPADETAQADSTDTCAEETAPEECPN